MPRPPATPPVGRAASHRLHRIRRHRRALGALGVFAVLGPGLLAGLSDDDPAGITTYSILGADDGYRLLWVLVLSTIALIVFHELAARTGIVTGKGLILLVRERYGHRASFLAVAALILANIGTICAELAGVAIGADLLFGTGREVAVPIAALAVSWLVLGSSFHRVEHVLLALSLVFVSYVGAGILAHPDWRAARAGWWCRRCRRHVRRSSSRWPPSGPRWRPWGLAFMQSYAVDKRLTVADLGYERVDVISGALLTGIIGFFVVVACAATLHPAGDRRSRTAATPRGRSSRSPDPRPRCCSGSASWEPGSWPRRSCRCRRPTRCARRPGTPRASTSAPRRRRSSTARSSWSWRSRRGSCWCRPCHWSRCSTSPRS